MIAKMIKLSICIPTYNRGAYIREAIQSVLSQRSPDVEIVVSDNGSTDNTQEIVAELQKQFAGINYFRVQQNEGIGRNITRVIELAKGEYCWFLGSDDRIEPNGIITVLKALANYPNLTGISLGYTPYDKELRQKGVSWNPTFGKYRQPVLFDEANQCLSVLGHYFGFFSAQVVKRELWMEVFQRGGWKELCVDFASLYMIVSMVKKRPRWLFLPQQCFAWRSGNDDHLKNYGDYELLRYELEDRTPIFRVLLGKSSRAYRAIMKTGAGVHASPMLLNARLRGINLTTRIKMAKLCFQYFGGYIFFWTNIVPILVMPVFILRPLKHIVRFYKKVFWAPIK